MPSLYLEPIIKPDPNKLDEAYEVTTDLSTSWNNKPVRVPKYFQFDGASIPSGTWQLIGTPFNPRFMLPSVFHDWVYHVHTLTRKAADDMFYEMLVQNDVGTTKSWLMYQAVSSFGGSYWDNDKDDVAYIQKLASRIKADGRNPADYGIKKK